jgi:hypothetical protein
MLAHLEGIRVPRRFAFFAALVCLAGVRLEAQSRLSDADQRAVELAVAAYIMNSGSAAGGSAAQGVAKASRIWVGMNYVLEPLLLVSGFRYLPDSLPAFRNEPDIAPIGESARGRDRIHLSQLAEALQINSVLNEAGACQFKFGDTECRYASYEGYVQMGSARLWGNIAEIIVLGGTVAASRIQGAGGGHRFRWFCALVKSSAGWNVSRCDHAQS